MQARSFGKIAVPTPRTPVRLGNEADEARFTFGNADRVMRGLANDVALFDAEIEFSLFHVLTGIKLDL